MEWERLGSRLVPENTVLWILIEQVEMVPIARASRPGLIHLSGDAHEPRQSFWNADQRDHDGIGFCQLIERRRGRGVAAQNPDRPEAELLGRPDIAVQPIADVDGAACLDTGFVQ